MDIKDLENTEIAFSHRSDFELCKLHFLFRLINNRILTNIGNKFVLGAVAFRLPIKGIVKATLFQNFCGGETLQECEKVIAKLQEFGLGVVLDYAVEAEDNEQGFIDTHKNILKAISRSKNTKMPFIAIKITGFVPFDLLQKVSSKESLSAEEQNRWDTGKQRLDEICKTANEQQVKLLVDAEESWIQDAIDDLTNEMMQKYNKDHVCIYNTFQLYRHDRLQYLKKSQQHATENNYILGAKLVRGAYLEKEGNRAKKMGYLSPIQTSKQNTDNDYNKALEFCIENINNIAVCAGTHNEQSSVYLTQLMEQKGITKDSPQIHFAQLYGMGDHISYNIAHAGYNVLKLIPYGPVLEAIPYLVRRAQENSAMLGQTSRELGLIIRERNRRRKAR